MFGSALTLALAQSAILAGEPSRPSWVLEHPLDALGGDVDRMTVDPGGGVWTVITGETTRAGELRVLYRPPGREAAWRVLYRGPTGTDLSLQARESGRLRLGFNQPLQGFLPTLIEIDEAGARPLASPRQRLDALEFQQVGAYAFASDDDGWACGQRGGLWRWRGDAWIEQAPVFALVEGQQARAYCNWIALDGVGSGVMGTLFGDAAALEGERWVTIDAGAFTFFNHGGGLAHDGESLARYVGHSLVALDDRCPAWDYADLQAAGLYVDERGRTGVTREAIVHLEDTTWTCEPSGLDIGVRAVAAVDGQLWVLSGNGIHRAERDRLPTFVDPPPGSLPTRIPYPDPVDIDFDGDDDVFAVVSSITDDLPSTVGGEGQLVLWRSDGGVFAPEALAPDVRLRVMRWQVAIGDFDGDVDLDLAIAERDGDLSLWRQRGGAWPRRERIGRASSVVVTGDVDGDGDLDLVDQDQTWLNDGAGQFSARAHPEPLAVPRIYDFDRDGRAEYVAHGWRDAARWMRLGDGALRPLSVVAEISTVGDLDLDGAPELLAQRLHIYHLALPFRACTFDGDDARCGERDWVDAPAGPIADLDRDGRPDIVVGSLRVDEMPPGSGAVRLNRPSGFVDVTYATGSLPRPTFLDADGDGDLDVYTHDGGLRINNLGPRPVIRLRLRAAESDRNAQGSWAVVRDADGVVVASGDVAHGTAAFGVPDPDARYSLSVSLPDGTTLERADVRPGETVELRDVEGARRLAALQRLWWRGTVARADSIRDGALPLLALLGAWLLLGWRGFGATRTHRGVGVGVGALAGLTLVGWTVRASGAIAWLLAPGVGVFAVTGAAAARLVGVWLVGRRAGPFALLEKLGEGAAATVWRARRGRSELALKLFHPDAMAHAESRERFFREARLGAEIVHPHVVRIRDSGQLDDGRCFLAMELVAGRTLAAELRARGRVDNDFARTVARDIASALAALHDAGIVHRDVKPENIMIRPDGRAVLTDLGLARSALFKTVTRHELAVGTLAYMSPEQALGRPLDGRSDLWSLAVVVYEMLAGHRPFDGEHELELVYVIHNVEPTPLAELRPDAAPELLSLVDRCMRRAVDERPSRVELDA